MKKRIALIGAGVFIFLGGQAFSSVPDDKFCQDLVIKSCTGCHGKERVCANLGKSKKSWKSLIKFMIANGAELSAEETEQLSDCMSVPSAGAQAACADVLPGATEK
ncbi:MAG: hypothetical protein OEM01_12640 [Desulfobulbaceae bacterium]|nr:hypothetical protein [Desulfobulbaceae bacterium]